MGDVKSQLFRNSSRPPRQSENVTLSITYIYITLQAHRNETFLFAFAVTANLKRKTILNPGVTDGSYCAVTNVWASLSDRRPLPSRLLPSSFYRPRGK